ncbi:hypothetical protein N8I77_008563 [Diaporthe amygdali]|uniref:C2H2-type domain-containing protein n=1 Tax=Phomopsis amygdali TaxID=1214568 RepID=A0AAD9SF89_PHOAM|nr:hypothetical protein N8I77_008563 [Diaporthe amygdali]
MPDCSAMSAQSDLSAFHTALKQFKDGLDHAEKEAFRLVELDDLLKEINDLQARLVRQRRGKNLARLRPFLEAIDQLGKVVEVFGNSSEFVAFVWGPMKFLLHVSISWSDAFHDLVDMYEKIGESLPQLLQTERLFHEDTAMRRVLALMYKDILEFHRLAMRYFKQPMLKQLFQATWKTYKTRFDLLISNIHDHGMLVQNQATLAQIEEFRRERLADCQQYEAQRLREMYTWLRSPNHDQASNAENDQYEYARVRKYCPSSGRWVLSKQAFNEWMDPAYPPIPPLLWINGVPGAGKSVLTSLIVEQVRLLSPAPTLLFFYCKGRDNSRDDFVSIARSFLSELLRCHQDILSPFFYDKFSKSNEAVLSKLQDIEELLRVSLLNCAKVYIVIDGIDECRRDERKRITSWFRDVVENLEPPNLDRVRCLFVSQDDGVARKDFDGITTLKIKPADVKDDIEQYSLHAAAQIQLKFQLSDDMTADMAFKMREAADGMILVVQLMASNLEHQTTVEEIEDELQDEMLPEQLSHVYDRIMVRLFERASNREKEASRIIFRWLLYAKRPLRWHEIQAAQAINLDEQSVEWERRRFRVEPKDLCGSLVTLSSDGRVDFVHSTARSYLARSKHIDLSSGELALANLCVDYLNMPGFHQGIPNLTSLVSGGHYGFMDYAVAHWVRHVEEAALAANEEDAMVKDLAESLMILLDIHFMMPTKQLYVSQSNKKRLQVFERLPRFHDLKQAVVWTHKELNSFGETREPERALDLVCVVNNIRSELEQALNDARNGPAEEAERLEAIYGPKPFKCDRLSCRYFYDGFTTAQQRQQHHDKHKLPFRCVVVGCPRASFGMASSVELEKHLKDTHGHPGNGDFPDLDEPSDQESATKPKRRKRPTATPKAKRPRISEWVCYVCSKVFRKKFNLESHMATHTDERQFRCGVCDLAFARASDRNRHEKTHEAREFVCGGELPDGQTWGCGQKFARADTLRNHHRTKAGQGCVRAAPLGGS